MHTLKIVFLIILHHAWNGWLSMYDTEGNKRICIPDNLSNCQQPQTRRKKYHGMQIQKLFFRKETSTYWKRKNKIFTCFHHQIDIIVACPKEISS